MKGKVLTILLFISCLGFGQGFKLNLLGDATSNVVNDRAVSVKLVEGINKTGGFWFDNQFNLDSSFSLQFLFRSSLDRNLEGASFVLQNSAPALLGNGGSNLGIPSVNSLVIEFDYQKSNEVKDPEGIHVALFKNGVNDHGSPELLLDTVMAIPINPSEQMTLKWEPEFKKLSLLRYACQLEIFTYDIDIKTDVFTNDNLVYGGFTAATSQIADTLDVLINYSSNEASKDVSICKGDSVVLSSGYPYSRWDSSSVFILTNRNELLVKPLSSTYYYASISAPCGDFVDSILVSVIEDEIVAIVGDTVVCEGDSLSLTTLEGTQVSWSSNSFATVENDSVSFTINESQYIKAQYEGQCKLIEDSVWITQKENPEFDIIEDEQTSLLSVNVFNSTEYEVYWEVPDGSQVNKIQIDGSLIGKYLVKVEDEYGCSSQREINVGTIAKEGQDYFSPNGDGVDEKVEVLVEGTSQIVNSAGQIIRKVKKGDFWDGTDQYGVEQRSGVYLIIGEASKQVITLLK